MACGWVVERPVRLRAEPPVRPLFHEPICVRAAFALGMIDRRAFLTCVALPIAFLAATAAPGLAAPGSTDADVAKQLAELRRLTARYHDLSLAEADGFLPAGECTEAPGLGGMGYHYLNEARLAGLDVYSPQLLLYEPRGERLHLVAVEYFVVALASTASGPAPWFGETAPPGGFVNAAPTLLGRTFDGPMPGHEPGMPWHYDMHVWLWKANPDGITATWNPRVDCP